MGVLQFMEPQRNKVCSIDVHILITTIFYAIGFGASVQLNGIHRFALEFFDPIDKTNLLKLLDLSSLLSPIRSCNEGSKLV